MEHGIRDSRYARQDTGDIRYTRYYLVLENYGPVLHSIGTMISQICAELRSSSTYRIQPQETTAGESPETFVTKYTNTLNTRKHHQPVLEDSPNQIDPRPQHCNAQHPLMDNDTRRSRTVHRTARTHSTPSPGLFFLLHQGELCACLQLGLQLSHRSFPLSFLDNKHVQDGFVLSCGVRRYCRGFNLVNRFYSFRSST